MATSGSTSVSVTNWDTLKFTWSITSQSVNSNTSTIAWTLQLISSTYGEIISSAVKDWSVTVNGVNYSGTNSVAIGNNSTKTLASGKTTITHNNDGSKSFSYSFSQEFGINFSGTAIGTKSGSGSGVLTNIPRSSSMTIPEVTIGSEGVIKVTSASTGFTHTITAKIGTYSTTIATKTSAVSIPYTLPLAWCNAIPNSTSGLCEYKITTYNGSTVVGSRTYSAKILVPSSVKPTISSFTATQSNNAIATKFGAFIKNKSEMFFVVGSSGTYGASIKRRTITFDGKTIDVGTRLIPTTAGALTAVLTVEDSRGRVATKSISVSVLEYESPHIDIFKVNRGNSDGTLNDEGACLIVRYKFNISPLSDKNDRTYTIECKASSETTFRTVKTGEAYSLDTTLIVSEGITTDDSYVVRLTLSDYFNDGITQNVDAPTAFVLEDYHSSGTGKAYGKVSQRPNSLEFNLPMYDQYDMRIRHGVAFYESAGSTDADTTLEELFISTKNTPTTDFWFVRQSFYSTKSATASRMQYAIPYDKPTKSNYRRNYVAGSGWSEWVEIPVLIEEGKSGIWTYRKWSNRKAELVGRIPISSVTVTTALGALYRSAEVNVSGYAYPFSFSSIPNLTMQYTPSNASSGLIWLTSQGTTSTPATFYFIRPSTADNLTGYVNVQVEGIF